MEELQMLINHVWTCNTGITTEGTNTPLIRGITGPGLMHQTGCSGLMHWDDSERLVGEGGGRGALDGEHMCAHGWFMSMFGKNHYNIVK